MSAIDESSGKPLVEKLGFQPGESVYVEDTPDWYTAFADENGLDLTPALPATHVHLFCDSQAVLDDFLKSNKLQNVEKTLWVSWLKQASGQKTDVNEHFLRDKILPLGWVDVKVAAIDSQWSGLEFVRRKK